MIIALGHKGNCISLIKDVSAFHDKQKKKVNTMKYINDRTFSNNQSYNWIVKLKRKTHIIFHVTFSADFAARSESLSDMQYQSTILFCDISRNNKSTIFFNNLPIS